jgi:hypothetical protein
MEGNGITTRTLSAVPDEERLGAVEQFSAKVDDEDIEFEPDLSGPAPIDDEPEKEAPMVSFVNSEPYINLLGVPLESSTPRTSFTCGARGCAGRGGFKWCLGSRQGCADQSSDFMSHVF